MISIRTVSKPEDKEATLAELQAENKSVEVLAVNSFTAYDLMGTDEKLPKWAKSKSEVIIFSEGKTMKPSIASILEDYVNDNGLANKIEKDLIVFL